MKSNCNLLIIIASVVNINHTFSVVGAFNTKSVMLYSTQLEIRVLLWKILYNVFDCSSM
jgi:hypothetical protein